MTTLITTLTDKKTFDAMRKDFFVQLIKYYAEFCNGAELTLNWDGFIFDGQKNEKVNEDDFFLPDFIKNIENGFIFDFVISVSDNSATSEKTHLYYSHDGNGARLMMDEKAVFLSYHNSLVGYVNRNRLFGDDAIYLLKSYE